VGSDYISIPKPTEDTITILLKDLLEKKGISAKPFTSINTPAGHRKPDLLCENGGTYLVEAKFHERDMLKAVAKIQNDYLKFSDIIGINGGFAIVYPRELSEPMPEDSLKDLAFRLNFKLVSMFPPKDTRNFEIFESTLQNIVEKISVNVLKPPEKVEPQISFIIDMLRESTRFIVNGMKEIAGEHIENFFGGRDIFQNILQYEKDKIPTEDVKLAAAYILVNQLLFYHVISKLDDRVDEINDDEIKKPSDLNIYFEKVYVNINYKAIFSYDILPFISPNFTSEILTIVNVIRGISPEKIKSDLLGTIFHDLIPFEIRKKIAAFYTNPLAAELLAWLSINNPDNTVADFAVGSGGLIVAAYKRKKYLIEGSREFSINEHKEFVENDILGIDVMPFAASVAASHLALQSPQFFTDRVQIGIWDSTDLQPGKDIPSAAKISAVLTGQTSLDMYSDQGSAIKGTIKLGNEIPLDIKMNKKDIIIMNPPFTRQERINKPYKSFLEARFKKYKDYLHGQMSYYGFFILLADRFLKKNGRMALVLPATVLSGKSTKGIRKLWSKNYHIEYIITTSERLAFSESTTFKEILIVARLTNSFQGDEKTKFAIIKELPTTSSQARSLAEIIQNCEINKEDSKIAVSSFNYSILRSDINNWFKFIAIKDLELNDSIFKLLNSSKLVPFTSLIKETFETDLRHFKFKKFHGFIVSDESRAIRSIDLWILEKLVNNYLVIRNRKLQNKVKIPLKVLQRGIRRLSHTINIDVSNTADYLILKWFNGIEKLTESLLNTNQLKSFNHSTVETWHTNFEKKKAYLLLARRPYLSSPGTSLIAFYSDNPLVGINFWALRGIEGNSAKIIALWLNSTFNLFQLFSIGITREGSWGTLHNYMINELRVPDTSLINDEESNFLLKVFDEVRYMEFPSILDQLKNKHEARMLIDNAWLKILGYKGNKKALLDKLYNSLTLEMELLRKL